MSKGHRFVHLLAQIPIYPMRKTSEKAIFFGQNKVCDDLVKGDAWCSGRWLRS
jgi:hypothetical protein